MRIIRIVQGAEELRGLAEGYREGRSVGREARGPLAPSSVLKMQKRGQRSPDFLS